MSVCGVLLPAVPPPGPWQGWAWRVAETPVLLTCSPPPSPRYWRFNEDTRSVDAGYPKPISVWVGIPPSPKGAFLSPDACK